MVYLYDLIFFESIFSNFFSEDNLLWYISLFVSKWVFILLIYRFVFILLKRMDDDKQESNTRLPAGVLGKLQVIQKNRSDNAQIPIGHLFNLQRNTSLGSDRANEIVLHDPTVSGQHAQMSWDGTGWRIKDLESMNGTFVNGRRCQPNREERVLFGQTLSLGGLTFKLLKG